MSVWTDTKGRMYVEVDGVLRRADFVLSSNFGVTMAWLRRPWWWRWIPVPTP